MSGSKVRWAGELAQREMSGAPIEQGWIDSLLAADDDEASEKAEMDRLMTKLEQMLSNFASTSKSAGDATAEYRAEVSNHVTALEAEPDEDGLRPLIQLSRKMLAKIRTIEGKMEQAQAEAEQLRKRLATARLEADIDPLTQLPNRRAFQRKIEELAVAADALDQAISVAFCDVDHFKRINDAHGHETGDRVLKAIGASLKEMISQDCFVARHGGEEFALLLSGLSDQEAWCKVDAARRALSSRKFKSRNSEKPIGRVTFSAGVTQIKSDEEFGEALGRADAALYQAKAEGRNRVLLG
ncbi:GGDEF domain-containing protein [Altererythrobacter lutimaris]|uniref:GGDEF domain-containing protein n=1 Tax=Altererythrobacter lutimaris TaxID=2743979 RepID=UPI001593E974|nr:GGDEF domain-containing protein [Altererythrobacter lutimaris]